MSWSRLRRGNKFGNKKVKGQEGHSYDSRAEAALHALLLLRERGGEIRSLAHHPGTVFLSAARIQYRPDFTWIEEESGQQTWGEMKGFETPEWRIKRRLWLAYGPGKLEVWKGSAARPFLHETLIPEGA